VHSADSNPVSSQNRLLAATQILTRKGPGPRPQLRCYRALLRCAAFEPQSSHRNLTADKTKQAPLGPVWFYWR